jgi:hypothetical protein
MRSGRLSAVLFGALIVAPSVAFAQATSVGTPSILPEGGLIGNFALCDFMHGQMSFDCIPLFIASLVEFLFAFIGTIALIEILIAGYQIIAANIMNKSTDDGKNRMRHALIGFVVSLLAFAIVSFAVSTI